MAILMLSEVTETVPEDGGLQRQYLSLFELHHFDRVREL
jgi:hypothetical protein